MFIVTPRTLIAYQIIAHCAFIYAFFIGTPINWAIGFLIYLTIATLGGTITYHRLLSHKSFQSPKWVEYLGSMLGSLGGNGSPLAWVAIHREHHRFTDMDKDPHGLSKGFFRVQFGSFIDTPKIRYVPDLLRSKFHVTLHQYYWLYNVAYLILMYSLFGVPGIIFGYFVPTLLVWHAGSFINTINHRLGYRNFETKDLSTNNLVLGYLVSGEGWHNNHHASVSDPQFGKKWWEFDLGYQIIKLIRK